MSFLKTVLTVTNFKPFWDTGNIGNFVPESPLKAPRDPQKEAQIVGIQLHVETWIMSFCLHT